MGREFRLDVLGHLGGLDRDPLLDALDEAVSERAVVDVPRSPGRLRFAHALIRDALYDDLAPMRRLRLHERAGAALEEVHAADLESHLSELAQQYVAAAPAGLADKAVDYARRAGDQALARLAFEEAVRHYDTALTLVEDGVTRCELLLALGEARARAGDQRAGKDAMYEAARLAEQHGLVGHLARAAVDYGGRMIWDVSRDDPRLVPLLERAMEASGEADSPMRVRLMARLAGGPLRDASFPAQRRARLSEDALAMARRIDDPGTLAYALHGYILGHHSPEHTRAQLELATELIEIAKRPGDLERVFDATKSASTPSSSWAASRCARRARRDGARGARAAPALTGVARGRPRRADRAPGGDARRRRAAGPEHARAWRARAGVERDRQPSPAALRAAPRPGPARRDGRPRARVGRRVPDLSDLALRARPRARRDRAQRGGARFAGRARARPLRRVALHEEWLVSTCLLADATGILAQADVAAVLYEIVVPYEDHIAICYPEVTMGAVARSLGVLAATLGRREYAERHFADASALHRRVGAQTWLAGTERERERLLGG